MTRMLVVVALATFGGTTLLLSELRWFRRRPLRERLAPFALAPTVESARSGVLTVESIRDVVAPLARTIGAALSSAFGVREDLAARLERCHATTDVTTFRVRQATWAAAALAGALVVAMALPVPALPALLFVVGSPLLAFLIAEQRAASASARWQRRLFVELPVVAEQLAMLIGAGFSLGAALNRLAHRGNGAVAADLGRVVNRVRQGLSEAEALAEWAALADVAEVRRLVAILALDRQGGDLSQLIAEEARTMRREAHRRTLEHIERRAQMVWVPVTMATLVPGVMFMAVPFIAALKDFAAL